MHVDVDDLGLRISIDVVQGFQRPRSSFKDLHHLVRTLHELGGTLEGVLARLESVPPDGALFFTGFALARIDFVVLEKLHCVKPKVMIGVCALT